MIQVFEKYIGALATKFVHKETSEIGYRTNFEILLMGIFESINVRRIDHDPRAIQGNKPDFIVLKNDVPIVYIEAKDIGISLDKEEKSEQAIRYFGYSNFVLTDYVEFRFYRNGLPYGEPIKIADYDLKRRTIEAHSQNYKLLAKTLLDFAQSHKEPIKSGAHLAMIMGGKAQRIRDNVQQFLGSKSELNNELLRVGNAIKKMLVHDLSIESFSDMYAQTLVYGLFVARYYDDSADTFSRQEARDLVPASNPFLQHFFDHITGPNFDKRLSYIVDELCGTFSHANVKELMEQYFNIDLWGEKHGGPDPVIHFYEDFLKEYDPELRKKMGAYYTPLPVVNFIVRSIDQILKKCFGLAQGLADTSKLTSGVHRVQILDPALGTGTFISATINIIYEHLLNQKQLGRWPAYVHNDLLPRLHGFEIMMAPYTIAHLKLSLAFKHTGFWTFHRRLGIYLTNSLEQAELQPSLFSLGLAASIADEAQEATIVKNTTPIMVVLGNPPYSISSSNKGEWIQSLVKIYKKDLMGEQNLNALSDDYVKFLRFAEHFIEKNKTGIVAMITNNSFIDGITHRQMRKHLLETFDEIYILDLHGNSKKKEKTPDGGKDENVFDIQQGVSINIFLRKNESKTGLGIVYHTEIFGKREFKFEMLNKSDIVKIKWQKLEYSKPYFFFAPKDFSENSEYEKGFKLDELFIEFGSGVKFRKDNLLVKNHFNKESVQQMLNDMNQLSKLEITQKYDFTETNDWKLEEKAKLFVAGDDKNIRSVQYRPLDTRYTYYPLDRINDIIPRGDSRKTLMNNLLKPNIALISKRGTSGEWNEVYVTNILMDLNYLSAQTYVFPLYLHFGDQTKTPNYNKKIIVKIEKVVGKTEPEDIFDYIYAILHSPNYRVVYKEFLKIDFPRVPYPKDKKQFSRLVMLGRELREIHLLELPKVHQFTTTYPVSGSDTVEKVTYKNCMVFINAHQYFGDVPEVAWNFYIGGYQPAQKWLKDRKGRTLSNSDIEHYQKIIVALVETYRIMTEINKINVM